MGLTRINNQALPTLDNGKLPSGSVLQVVNSFYQTQTTHSHTAWSDTGLQATITPTSTSSKILVMINQHCNSVRYGGAIRVLKDSSVVYEPSETYAFYLDPSANSNWRQYHSYNHLDSPSTTSTITYKTQGKAYSNLASLITQQASYFRSFITLMEIAG